MVSSIIIVSPSLKEIVEENKSTRAWVGRKYDGIYRLQKRRSEEVRKDGARIVWNKAFGETRKTAVYKKWSP